MTEWQPIETVPYNEAVLVWSPRCNDVLIASFNTHHSWWSLGLGQIPLDHPLTPTLWTRLPAPPEGDQR